jgi:diadenosine tetraphosphate (Ap4A) HIT family hydrolase|tara:strand:+ start:166 stop:561 length:396 start_codon:yes stop_codon:yes gene_type:complete
MEKINKNFIKDSHYITMLKLCSVRLINNSKFPWLILIPNRKKITDISELNKKDQILLMQEIVYTSKIVKKAFRPFNLNVEKIGNIVPELHIHIIARFKNDSAWPLSVWVIKKKDYNKKNLHNTIIRIKKFF